MTATPREFDIVLYGATGFVGKLTADYLAQRRGRRADRAGRQVHGPLLAPFATPWGIRAGLAGAGRRRLVAVDAG